MPSIAFVQVKLCMQNLFLRLLCGGCKLTLVCLTKAKFKIKVLTAFPRMVSTHFYPSILLLSLTETK